MAAQSELTIAIMVEPLAIAPSIITHSDCGPTSGIPLRPTTIPPSKRIRLACGNAFTEPLHHPNPSANFYALDQDDRSRLAVGDLGDMISDLD